MQFSVKLENIRIHVDVKLVTKRRGSNDRETEFPQS